MRSARFGFQETTKDASGSTIPRPPLHCTYCGRLTSAWTCCDACGGVYCSDCAVIPEEPGGWDCPDPGCNCHPIR